MSYMEPPPNLVPSEVPASGHHGFVKWGHDAKITRIGIILTRGSPGQGKANGPQDGRLRIRSGLLVGIEIWGRQSTTRGARNWGPKRGSFWLLEMSQNSGVLPIVYLNAGLEIGSAIPYAIHPESNRDSHALAPGDLHATRRGDNPNWVHKCQNGKIVHTQLGLAP